MAKSIIAYHRTGFTTSYQSDKLTHIIYAWATIDINDSYNIVPDSVTDLTNLVSTIRAESDTCKVILGIGGWAADGFSQVAKSSSLRTQFANQCLSLIQTYDLDGVDLDWEYPNRGEDAEIEDDPDDGANFILLLQKIRDIIGNDKEISIAAANYTDYTTDVDVSAIAQIVDRIHIMTYDFSNGSTHHSNLYNSSTFTNENSANDVIQRFISEGVSPEKIIFGMPWFGKQHKIGWTWSQGDIGYTTLVDSYINKNGWVRYFDYQALNPYLYKPSTGEYIFYEDSESLIYKCDYIKNNSLGGMMYWRYELDDSSFTLLNTIYDELQIPATSKIWIDIIEGELLNLNEDVFIGAFNSNITNCTTIYVYDPGKNSIITFDTSYINQLGMQLRIRDASYMSGYVRTQTILDVFKKYSCKYFTCFIKNGVISLGQDKDGNAEFVINFYITIINE